MSGEERGFWCYFLVSGEGPDIKEIRQEVGCGFGVGGIACSFVVLGVYVGLIEVRMECCCW